MAQTKADWLHKLKGTVVCIASGPSLTAEDCELVRESGLPTIVTNTTFKLCPWATVLVAHDEKWWKTYFEELKSFPGHKVTGALGGRRYGAQSLALLKFRTFRNSGAAAISLAALARAQRVVMLGYDCQHTGGKTHWHGDHPAGLGNAGSVPKWPAMFQQVKHYAKQRGCEVVNASRATALTCFPRVELEDVLPAPLGVAA